MTERDVLKLTCEHWRPGMVLKGRPVKIWSCNKNSSTNPPCVGCREWKRADELTRKDLEVR